MTAPIRAIIPDENIRREYDFDVHEWPERQQAISRLKETFRKQRALERKNGYAPIPLLIGVQGTPRDI